MGQELFLITDAEWMPYKTRSGAPGEMECFVFVEGVRAQYVASALGSGFGGYDALALSPEDVLAAIGMDSEITHVGYYKESLEWARSNPGMDGRTLTKDEFLRIIEGASSGPGGF